MEKIYWAKLFAWVATGLCAVISVRSAEVFVRHQRRIYSILLLFALIWAMLLPYYSEQPPQDIILGFTGFLLWNVGRLVSEETGASKAHHGPVINALAPWLFVAMVSPSILKILSHLGLMKQDPWDPWWTPTLATTTLVSLVGYWSIYDSFRYSDNKIGKGVLGAALFVYGITESWFVMHTYWLRKQGVRCPYAANFFRAPYCEDMNRSYLLLFMILKLALTITFICLVLRKNVLLMEVRVLRPWERVAKFFLGNAIEPADDHIESILEAAKNQNEYDDALCLLTRMARTSAKAKEALDSLRARGKSTSASA